MSAAWRVRGSAVMRATRAFLYVFVGLVFDAAAAVPQAEEICAAYTLRAVTPELKGHHHNRNSSDLQASWLPLKDQSMLLGQACSLQRVCLIIAATTQ
jgi:hypothetical protein